ncbi:DUF7577 domain-containing protein [Natronoarchaeum mannanilyticum]|uniref:DUF7577 domain-containing protein n=1 Tax=Natronoarchaeum mannanilyticum TaxID=926360 RepID=A0AAV3TDS4_9EURY
MLSTGAAPPAVQLAITLLLCVVPTLALFGLLRLLEWLRDDDLVERVAAETDEPVEPAAIDAFLAKGASDGSSGESGFDRRLDADDRPDAGSAATAGAAGESTDETEVRCRHCGAPNPDGVRYCEECVGRI